MEYSRKESTINIAFCKSGGFHAAGCARVLPVPIFVVICRVRLAKEAARSHRTNYEYNRIPISAITYDAAEEAVRKWQTEWTTSLKAAATRQYFPSVRERLGMRIHLTPKLTAVLSGHGKTRAYLHRFKLREEATCICGKEDQTMDHLLFNCIKTREQRDLLKRRINKQMNLQVINRN